MAEILSVLRSTALDEGRSRYPFLPRPFQANDHNLIDGQRSYIRSRPRISTVHDRFGCAITDDETYRRCAAPGFELAAETDTEILARLAVGSIFRSYNMLLDWAKEHYDLEALVILHQDAEIVDPDFIRKVREALAIRTLRIVGCAGAIDVRSIAWWEGSVTWASFIHRFDDFGGGEISGDDLGAGTHPRLRRDRSGRLARRFRVGVLTLGDRQPALRRVDRRVLHGYDFDICLQARAAGKKVVTARQPRGCHITTRSSSHYDAPGSPRT